MFVITGMLGYEVAVWSDDQGNADGECNVPDRDDFVAVGAGTRFSMGVTTSGEIVAQADVIPRGWTYPTNWWERGEVVEDKVVLSLKEVPSGEYELYVGWYDMDTGQRLPVNLQTGDPVPDRSVFLTTIDR